MSKTLESDWLCANQDPPPPYIDVYLWDGSRVCRGFRGGREYRIKGRAGKSLDVIQPTHWRNIGEDNEVFNPPTSRRVS